MAKDEQRQTNLSKLDRAELLELLLAVTEQNEFLRHRLMELEEELDDRTIIMKEAGSIADASLQLNGVFYAAEAAAAQYLDSIRLTEQHCQTTRSEAEAYAAEVIMDAEKQAEEILSQARGDAEQIKLDAQMKAEAYWATVSQRLERFFSEHRELKDLLGLKNIK